MNFINFLSVSILTALGVQAHGQHGQDKKCSRELEGIVYVPKVCAFEYLKKITETLTVNGPLLFVPETAKPLFEKFESTYKVRAHVADAFGIWYNYPGGTIRTLPVGTHSLAQAYGIGEGFTNLEGRADTVFPDGAYIYSKLLWNFDGQMYTLSVTANKTLSSSLTNFGCC